MLSILAEIVEAFKSRYYEEKHKPMKFRKIPVEIEAVRWDGQNEQEIHQLNGNSVCAFRSGGLLKIYTLEGEMTALPGDWIIKGVHGELYPCKPDIFALTYENLYDPQNSRRK